MAGVMNIDDIYMDVAKNFDATRYQFYTTVALPGAMPMILQVSTRHGHSPFTDCSCRTFSSQSRSWVDGMARL